MNGVEEKILTPGAEWEQPMKFWLYTLFYAAGFIVLIPEPGHAWGPGTHYYLARNLLEMGMITGTFGALLEKWDSWFYYGSVVADVVIGKGFLSYEQHTHNWGVAEELQERARNSREQAFAAGVWVHLAADTVAHNEFVPDFFHRVRMPKKLAHAYWEFRVERWIPSKYWRDLEQLVTEDFAESEAIFEQTIRGTVVPFPVNWAVMKSVLKISSLRSWRRLADFYVELSTNNLTDDDLAPYLELCLTRMRDSLGDEETRSEVLKLDPTGVFPEHHGS